MGENLEELTVQSEEQKSQLVSLVNWAKQQQQVNEKTDKVLVEHEEEIGQIKDEIIDIKDNYEIQDAQKKELRRHGAIRMHTILKTKKEYVNYSHKFFGRMWGGYKKQFGISSYAQTRRKDYQAGLDFIDAWAPNIEALKEEADEERRIKEQERLRIIFAAKDELDNEMEGTGNRNDI